jgi:hypothetical protein
MLNRIAAPTRVTFPTLAPECNDTERRSLVKINGLLDQVNATLAALAVPGASQVARTNYVYGISYTIPPGVDLLDVSCYNPNDTDQWVFVMITPGAPQAGQQPMFPIRVYAHNHGYYEAMTSGLSVPAGDTFSIAVSSAEMSLVWGLNCFLAIRHS